MIAVILGSIAGVLVLRWTGFRWEWPWRIADLEINDPTVAGGDRIRSRDVDVRPQIPTRGVIRVIRRLRRRVTRRADGTDLDRSIPFTADLLLVATSAGHTIHSAVEIVSDMDDGPAGRALLAAWSGFVAGSTLADELRALPQIHGDSLRPLVDTLVMGLSSGTSLEPALHRLADRERQRVRRRTEQRVRRLPILLLGPLVVFVLPSFVVLTILPVLLVTARGAGL